MIKKILKSPATLLKMKSKDASVDEARQIAVDLIDTLAATPGAVGLAAPQIGYSRRVVAVMCQNGIEVLVNPVITCRSPDQDTLTEGCLSCPGAAVKTQRYRQVVVKYTNVSTAQEEMKAFNDYEAAIVQHEVDHLDGILITSSRARK